jgi:hypothetical protein
MPDGEAMKHPYERIFTSLPQSPCQRSSSSRLRRHSKIAKPPTDEMGRVPVPKKLSSSAQDPFYVETAAAAATKRKHVKPINEPSVLNDAEPVKKPVKQVKPPPAYATSATQAKNFDNKELRKVFDVVLQRSSDARAILQAYVDTPRGSKGRPFDYREYLTRFQQDLDEADDEEWFKTHDAAEIQEDVDGVEEMMGYKLCIIEEDTKTWAAYPESKIAGIDILLQMAGAIGRTKRLDDVEKCGVNHKEVLKGHVFKTVRKLFDRMWLEHKNPFRTEGFAALIDKVQEHPELSKTLQTIKQKQADVERGQLQ